MSKDKYSDIFKIESTRLKNWDYSSAGLYYVTILTRNRENYLGEITSEQMTLSDIGKEVLNQWTQTPLLRKDMNITLDEFTIMPNHFHGIIGIGKNEYNTYPKSRQNSESQSKMNIQTNVNSFGPQKKNLSSVIRGFKSSITSFANDNHLLFDWHPRFHDSIIKDEKTLCIIRKYIRNNVKKWNADELNKCKNSILK